MQNGVGKSVFSRWLKDFRTGQNREQKSHTPLSRTLSANVKVKDRKKKICRTLSANQKDRKKEDSRGRRDGDGNWASDIFYTRNYKSFAGEDLNGYLDDAWMNGTKCRDRSFSNPSPERFKRWGDSPQINRSALVSYLDEEGLRKTYSDHKEENPKAESNKSRDRTGISAAKQDGSIMPASSFQKKGTSGNHYENRESLLLNEKNRAKHSEKPPEGDSLHIEYSGKDGFGYFEHSYENLETTDYISWSSEKSDRDCEVNKSDEELRGEQGEKAVVGGVVEGGFRFGYEEGEWYGGQDEPEAPARDPSSLKSIKYGPGHEKYPSWPGSVRPETGDKPQRSHSWTEQTNYPKEKVTSYVRPPNKRTNPAFTQQLKTVMERCEKISPDTYQKTMDQVEEREKRLYLPRVDREGKSFGDQDYLAPSPPERDKPALTQADLEKYYQDAHLKIDNGDYSTPYDDIRKPPPLTQADLEEYARSYDDVLKPLHQHQGSYAQSEGYHSYVSSSELTTTPFLDRLRRDSAQHWSEEDGRPGRDSVVTTSSGSVSSSETLKWHGSMSDVSVASSSCRSRQLIAHSSRVAPAQRHHSESVLYLGNQAAYSQGKDRSQQLKLFPVNTYTVQPSQQNTKTVVSPTSMPKMSVADRISELERQQHQQQQQQQQQQQPHRFAYFDPEKRHKIADPTLRAIQKKALLSFYERHQHHSMGLASASSQPKVTDNWNNDPLGQDVSHSDTNRPPPPPPRPPAAPTTNATSDFPYACTLLGPVIVGPTISIDDWVPELPPKKPHLRTIPPPLPRRTPSPVRLPPPDPQPDSSHRHQTLPAHDRMPTPDLPPPPPPPPPDDDSPASDEPLPPPPPELQWHLATAVPRRTTTTTAAAQPTPSSQTPPPDAYQIQYDQDAINAIMESNRIAALQKKKYPKNKHKDQEDKSALKNHIENRPPLPLPRDVATDRKQFPCDRGNSHKSKENAQTKSAFLRNFSKPETGSRGSVKAPKNLVSARSSLRYPPNKLTPNAAFKHRLSPPNTAPESLHLPKPFAVKKVSEYECRMPHRDRDGLSVFDTTAIDDANQDNALQPPKRSNSKAAFLALRREKELGVTDCEGSYKLTVSQSGETIDTSSSEKSPLELVKMKEKSTENLVLDNRLTLEPPDLIPKISSLNRKSSSVQDVRDNRKKYDGNRFNDKYRLMAPEAAGINRAGLLSENLIQNECRVTTFGQQNDSERSPVTTVECVRAVITKPETEPPERLEPRKDNYQSRDVSAGDVRPELHGPDKYGVSFTLGRPEPEKGDKAPSLLRVRSNLEKRPNRSDSIKSTEGKVERSKSLKLIERSTSFGRTDTMRIVEVSDGGQKRNPRLSVSDASSQTDLLEEEPFNDEETQRKLDEEMEYERLSRDLASQLSPSDKLQSLLVPDSERKKPTDYVASLFRLELSSKPRRLVQRRDKASEAKQPTTSDVSSQEVVVNGGSQPEQSVRNEESAPVFAPVSSGESKSAGKPSGTPSEDPQQVQRKKEELMARLGKRLVVLKEERDALTKESTANEELGTSVANCVAKSARPHELAKYRLHVEEVGKITSLLLGLSGRLAKAENTLLGLPSHHDDRKTHESRRDKLQEQLAEAKQLKENIDKRSDSVAKTLGKYLNADEYADYVHFIRTKAKLIVELREIADKIAFGEEQLAALKET